MVRLRVDLEDLPGFFFVRLPIATHQALPNSSPRAPRSAALEAGRLAVERVGMFEGRFATYADVVELHGVFRVVRRRLDRAEKRDLSSAVWANGGERLRRRVG